MLLPLTEHFLMLSFKTVLAAAWFAPMVTESSDCPLVHL